MNSYSLISLLLTFAIAISYINHRYIKMQPTIAIMFAAICSSLILFIFAMLGFNGYEVHFANLIGKINFHDFLMNGVLGYLLFAGSLTVDLSELLKQKKEVFILALLGTLVSTFLIGSAIYYVLTWLGIPQQYLICLLFGALISPTDPIAVLAMCKVLKAPRNLTTTIAGESLFNDGIGIVIFISLYQLTYNQLDITVTNATLLFLREAVGGILYGVALGLIGYYLMRPIRDYHIEILITIAIVSGGYTLANLINVSGPLAMVAAGIMIGNTGTYFKQTKRMSENLYNFWELIDEVLNAILFLLIGFEILLLKPNQWYIYAGLIAILVTLGARFIIVAVPYHFLRRYKTYNKHIIKILTWGGLRGGLAVALALALPASHARDLILVMTYCVVAFSILIQGTTIKSLLKLSD